MTYISSNVFEILIALHGQQDWVSFLSESLFFHHAQLCLYAGPLRQRLEFRKEYFYSVIAITNIAKILSAKTFILRQHNITSSSSWIRY